MIFHVHVEEIEHGGYLASCDEPQAAGRGLSPASALDQLRAELRYQLEICPCHGVDPGLIELDVA